MRHRKAFNHLSRASAPRKALLMNLAKGLICHKRITTTLAKAKALRRFIEPILTKTKNDTPHSRRLVFSAFQDKHTVKELFGNIAEKIHQRPGGYVRVIKLAKRFGDDAAMGMIELVDYNQLYVRESRRNVKSTRRSKRKKSQGVLDQHESTDHSLDK